MFAGHLLGTRNGGYTKEKDYPDTPCGKVARYPYLLSSMQQLPIWGAVRPPWQQHLQLHPGLRTCPSYTLCWYGFLPLCQTLMFCFYGLRCNYGWSTFLFRALSSSSLPSPTDASLQLSCRDLHRSCGLPGFWYHLWRWAGLCSSPCFLLPVCTPSTSVVKVILRVH